MAIMLTDQNFEQEVLQSQVPVLVDFWAEWCGPCRMLAPTIDAIAKEYEGKLKVCKLNVDEASEMASKYGVMSIPTLMLFKNGAVAEQTVGALPKEKLAQFISPHLAK